MCFDVWVLGPFSFWSLLVHFFAACLSDGLTDRDSEGVSVEIIDEL